MNGAQNEQQQGAYSEAQIKQEPQGQPYGGTGNLGSGYQANASADLNRKSPVLATLLSMMPGLGQIYVGYYQQGFINMFVVAGTISILASSMMRGAEPFFGVFIAFFWIYQMIDANRRAHHYNRVMAGLGGEDVPDGFSMPTTKGSMLGGGILILVGVLFILDLNFNVSMEWVENWWPLILVLVGVNLVLKARKKSD
jgi:TM2 domain-containing membrane protein YozV